MNPPKLDPKAIEKTRGPAWDGVREQFFQICDSLLGVTEASKSELTTIYVKFTDETNQPYAVVWIKNSRSVVAGLTLPEGLESDVITDAPKGMKYPNLTGYVTVPNGEPVPKEFAELAGAAYKHSKAI